MTKLYSYDDAQQLSPSVAAVEGKQRKAGEDRTGYVYAVVDQGERRYIGKSFNPFARFLDHLRNASAIGSAFERWLVLEAQAPRLLIVDEVTVPPGVYYGVGDAVEVAESLETMRALLRGEPILNTTIKGHDGIGTLRDSAAVLL